MGIVTEAGRNEVSEMVLKYLIKAHETGPPPVFPVEYNGKQVGIIIYSYDHVEDKIIEHVTITDNQIVEDMKANKKWLDLSILDRGQVRDIQEE